VRASDEKCTGAKSDLESSAVHVFYLRWQLFVTTFCWVLLWLCLWLQPRAELKPQALIIWEFLFVMELVFGYVDLLSSTGDVIDSCTMARAEAWAVADRAIKAEVSRIRLACTAS
jgi:hypothetical protein